MPLHPSTPAHAHAHASTHAATHAARHATSKARPALSADDQEGGGFAAQLLRAQPAHDQDAKPADARPKADAEKKHVADAGDAKDGAPAKDGKDAKTADAKAAAVDPSALMPWAQQIAPPTTSLVDKGAATPAADDLAGDALGALRQAAGKGGKGALLAGLGKEVGRDGGLQGARDAVGFGAAAPGGGGAATAGAIEAALAKADGAVKAATDARDSLAALLPQPDPATVQAGAIGAPPNALMDANPAAAQAAATPPAQATLPMPPHSPAFMPALGQQIEVWMKNGVQHAEVHLNPQDLGPIRVRIEMEGALARVQMSADVQSTRDALQQAMPQLSETLGQVGLSLSGGGVSDQPAFQSQAQAQANADGGFGGNGGRAGAGGHAGTGSGVAGADPGAAAAVRQQARRRGLLDMYV